MNKHDILSILVGMIGVILILFVGVIVLTNFEITVDNYISYCMCCNSTPCSDTYYDQNLSLCVNKVGISEYIYKSEKNISECYLNAVAVLT